MKTLLVKFVAKLIAKLVRPKSTRVRSSTEYFFVYPEGDV